MWLEARPLLPYIGKGRMEEVRKQGSQSGEYIPIVALTIQLDLGVSSGCPRVVVVALPPAFPVLSAWGAGASLYTGSPFSIPPRACWGSCPCSLSDEDSLSSSSSWEIGLIAYQ